MNWLSLRASFSICIIALTTLFTGCKEFIEPSIAKRTVLQLAPANGSESKQYSQTFWWETVEDALKYRLQVVSPDFDKTQRLILDTLVAVNKFNYTLEPGSYEWRIRAENGSSQTAYVKSAFVVYASSIKDQQVQLQLPASNVLTSQSSNTFTWLKLFGADLYILQIDTNNFVNESKLFLNEILPGQEFSLNFERDKLYKWRVKAKNDTVESKWSEIRNITFDKTPPAAVVLTAPVNNESVSKPVTLRWNTTATATRYQLYVYKTESRTPYGTKFPVSLSTTSYSFTEGSLGEKIYWEVRALDEAGNAGSYSELRNFVIQ